MQRQAESLLHSLEGIDGMLSQLELYCYKLERSIGELRSDGTVKFRCPDRISVRACSMLTLLCLSLVYPIS